MQGMPGMDQMMNAMMQQPGMKVPDKNTPKTNECPPEKGPY